MNYGICSNGSRDNGYETAKKTAEILSRLGATPVFEIGMDDVCPKLKEVPGALFEDFTEIDLKTIISIGGDGTFLSKVAKYRDIDTEFIGVNLGSIGFLNEILNEDLEKDLEQLVSGNYKTIDRTQLKCEVYNKNGKLKGSAYSLSAGGPILMPGMKDIIVTPICSHTLNGYTYVATPESEIKITLESIESAPLICPDGRDFVELESYDSIEIKRYDKVLKTVCLRPDSFFANVRKKIVQRGYFYENR